MTKIRIELPKLHPAQRLIYEDQHRNRVLCCGRRFGKTELARVILAVEMLTDKKQTAYFTPTNDDAYLFWKGMVQTLGAVVSVKNESRFIMTLVNGSTLKVKGVKAFNRQRGQFFDLVVIDEAAYVDNLRGVWNDVIRPTLVDKRGRAVFLSTPSGLNYFHTLFSMQDHDPENWASFRFPTSANPVIHPDEITEAQKTTPARAFSQEYLAEFLTDGGAVFGRLNEAQRKPSVQHIIGPVVFGVDWGRQNDFTAIAVLDLGGGRLIEMVRFNQIDWATQRARIVGLYNRYRPQMILAEQNSIGGPNIEALQRDGLPIYPFMTTQQSKALIIDGLALAFEQGTLILPEDAILINELTAFSAKRLPSGAISYSAPDGQHDDTVIALALALHAGKQGDREARLISRAYDGDEDYDR